MNEAVREWAQITAGDGEPCGKVGDASSLRLHAAEFEGAVFTSEDTEVSWRKLPFRAPVLFCILCGEKNYLGTLWRESEAGRIAYFLSRFARIWE